MNWNKIVMASAGILCSLGMMGQTSQGFNSSPGSSLPQVKSELQAHCWFFPGFDINKYGWLPGIEGDGAMVSTGTCTASQQSGIATPLMDLGGPLSVEFKYKVNAHCGTGNRRWLKLYLTDNNNIIQSLLDSIDISDAQAGQVYAYNKTLTAASGCYRLFVNYQGYGGSNALAIDALKTSASLKFSGGCAEAPKAVKDNITGAANHHASGNVLVNDITYSANGHATCYLMSPSPDGTVQLNGNGTFSFTPNEGFTGSSTSFTYKVCDQSPCTALCSEDARVTISFPNGSFLPISMIDFGGIYKNEGNVELNWVTTFEQNNKLFEIERSLDGNRWLSVGKVEAQGVSGNKHSYRFTDKAGKNTAIKKDLYYRLKQVDFDGKTYVSRILVVRIYNTRTLKMISVTPNPARNDIAANIQLNERSVVVLKIINNSGNEITRKTLRLDEGSNNVLMDGTSTLQPGMYFLEMIVNSRERMIVKLVKE